MHRNRSVRLAMFVLAMAAVAGSVSAQTSRLNPDETANSSSASVTPPVHAVAADSDYIIGPDDVLVVNVWKEPELSRSVLVRPDGKITLPLLKDVEASGSTPSQLQNTIERGLADFISKPVVTVILQEQKSHKFNILGNVQKPGSYLLNTPMTVLDAIALAGGFREWAKVNNIYILRESSSGTRTRMPFHYREVVKGSGQDLQLKVKDTIIVP